MAPTFTGIDHIHVYAPSREEAAAWFEKTLGFHVVESLREWAAHPGGPLTIADATGRVHLALFSKEDYTPSTAPAFGCDADNFLAWKALLENTEAFLRVNDHNMAWSLYFTDPFGNTYEITTYDHEPVRAALSS